MIRSRNRRRTGRGGGGSGHGMPALVPMIDMLTILVVYLLVHAADYKTLPAKLRMTAMAKPGVDKVDFELWSLVVSAINGCGMCLEAHEKVCREHLSPEQIQAAVRIAATVHAVARTLAAEEALAAPLAQAA